MSKARRHLWLVVLRKTGKPFFNPYTTRARARTRLAMHVAFNRAFGPYENPFKVVQFIPASEVERLARERLREMLFKYVTAPDKTKTLRLTVV